MIRLTPRSTLTVTLFPYTTLFRSITGRGRFTEATLYQPGSHPTFFRIAGRREHGVVLVAHGLEFRRRVRRVLQPVDFLLGLFQVALRSEEHTSELQSLMRISYAVFCLKKKQNQQTINTTLSP